MLKIHHAHRVNEEIHHAISTLKASEIQGLAPATVRKLHQCIALLYAALDTIEGLDLKVVSLEGVAGTA